MLGSTVLDVAIGLIFVFLLVSLMVTAVTELIASVLKWRADTLWQGIQNLLDSPGAQEWASKLYAHPLIQGLSPLQKKASPGGGEGKAGPSYIPSRTFAVSLVEILKAEAKKGLGAAVVKVADPAAKEARAAIDAIPVSGATGTAVKNDLRQLLDQAQKSGYTAADFQRNAGELIDSLPDERLLDLAVAGLADTRLGRSLQALISESERDIESLKQNIEVWFNNSMDRVSGWYKRKTQWVHAVLALVLVVGVNVDSILIVESLSQNSTLRDSLVAQAQTYAKQTTVPQNQTFQQLREQMQQLDLPIGWRLPRQTATTATNAPQPADPDHRLLELDDLGSTILFHLWGWLLTAIAASLGAPFWFDMLNKVITIRSAGKAPEETPKSPKEVPQPLEPGQAPPPAVATS
ncbi:MAG TPA: hypothetical protein VOA87_21850 [Thermoanaerobaculia bacterium]|nr:hypothetical protein [Thermoanaerobaculia bacterium]